MPTVQRTVDWKFHPRSYQLKLYEAMRTNQYAVCVWHRRAGKDLTALNWLIPQALQVPGVYYYFFPTYSQGKKILWHGQDKGGNKFLSYIPRECIIGEPHDTELYVKLKTIDGRESMLQVIGTDNIDTIVGTNPRGCIFSEYSLQSPRAWDFIRPILRENGGWAIFIYTPRGKNHGWRLYQMAKNHPNWFCESLDVTKTFRDAPGESGARIITDADIEDERRTGMDEELIQQEYFCKFTGALQGAYYGRLLQIAEDEGRLTDLPYNPNRPVQTCWDIGVGDQTAIWFWQYDGNWVNLIDYHEDSGKGLTDYARLLQQKPYVYGHHAVPHDISVKEWARGEKRLEVFQKLIGNNVIVSKKLPIDEGIDMTRRLFPRFRIDRTKCAKGIDALQSYVKEFDEEKQIYKPKPLHNWASHAADSLRTLATTEDSTPAESDGPRQIKAEANFDPFSYHEEGARYDAGFDPFNY